MPAQSNKISRSKRLRLNEAHRTSIAAGRSPARGDGSGTLRLPSLRRLWNDGGNRLSWNYRACANVLPAGAIRAAYRRNSDLISSSAAARRA